MGARLLCFSSALLCFWLRSTLCATGSCKAPEECATQTSRSAVLLQKTTRVEAVVQQGPEMDFTHKLPIQAGMMHNKDAVRDAFLVELMSRRGTPLQRPRANAQLVTLPWETSAQQQRPLVACEDALRNQEDSDAERRLEQAVSTFCSAGLGQLAEFFVDSRSVETRANLSGADGWIDEAFVSFMALHQSDDNIGAEMDLLLQSVHHFSEKPIVVANFGQFIPPSWTPERFPRLVLVHARDAKALTEKSFNFNKLTAMLFTRVKTGIALDADQWVNSGLDYLFDRARMETTRDYPYPILPVHWMSRDPESDDMRGYPDGYTFHFVSSDAPRRSMRWGHAHPTWTYHALPWLARWTSYVLAPSRTAVPGWLQQQGWVEDEDLLNMGLWAVNATKQWCKYDTPSPGDFKTYLLQQVKARDVLFPDSKWFPHGIAYIFFTAHDAKKPEESYSLLRDLWGTADDHLRAVYYRGDWYNPGEVLQKRDAGLKCLA